MGKADSSKTISRKSRSARPQDSRHAGSLHGNGIVLHIQRASDELLNVGRRPLYPLASHEQSGWVASEWAFTERIAAPSTTSSRAGRRQLEAAQENFDRLVRCRAVLRYA